MNLEILSWLPKFLAETAYKIFSLSSEEGRAKKIRFSELLERIAECIEAIGVSISQGEHPVQQCAELTEYLKKIQLLSEEIVDKKMSDKIFFWLYHVEAVPGVAVIDMKRELTLESKPPWSKSKRQLQSQRILEISGSLKASANLLRV
ncbi:hypothetical protein [Microbulbifer hainanensis]|uniref:hypothetical protein n=1 Tax=Microbulbifer hainanensis TaxID=2735675 RepID=UPI001865AD01|nr:hypothetical protein [Microbulbifer hainanensis]